MSNLRYFCDFDDKSKTCSQSSIVRNNVGCHWLDVGGYCGCFVKKKLPKRTKRNMDESAKICLEAKIREQESRIAVLEHKIKTDAKIIETLTDKVMYLNFAIVNASHKIEVPEKRLV